MKRIPLTQGLFAQVGDEDYDYLNQFKWHAKREGKMTYAVRNGPRDKITRKQTKIRMHRLILLLSGKWNIDEYNNSKNQTDHKDGSGINNQRENVRPCTNQQNAFNRGISTANTSGLKGASWAKTMSKWNASIKIDGKRSNLGYFNTKEEAALTYNKVAKELHGDFANLSKVLKKNLLWHP